MVLLESQRITYELRLLMHLIHIRQAPQCLSHRVSIVSAASGRYRLRLTDSADYFLLRMRTKFGEQITLLSYFGPSDLHDITGTNTYRNRLKKKYCLITPTTEAMTTVCASGHFIELCFTNSMLNLKFSNYFYCSRELTHIYAIISKKTHGHVRGNIT